MQLIIVILTITNVLLKTESCEVNQGGCEQQQTVNIFKCCPFGMMLDKSLYYNETTRNNKQVCRKSTKEFNPPVYDGSTILTQSAKELFNISIEVIPCPGDNYLLWFASDYENYTLVKNGTLHINWIDKFVDPQNYCIDHFVEDSTQIDPILDAFICLKEETETEKEKEEEKEVDKHYVNAICMLVSCVFILLTLSVYIYIAKYQTLHEKIFIIYLTCLFFVFLLFGAIQILQHYKSQTINRCLTLTFLVYCAVLSTFFWLNVMCYDMWRNFIWHRNAMTCRKSMRSKLRMYAIYAFGCSAILCILLMSLEFSGLPDTDLLPQLRAEFIRMDKPCFLTGNRLLLYVYLPITIPCIANIIFFMHIMFHIIMSMKQTAMKSKESARHGQHSQQQPLFYGIRLFILMGINWILETLSACYQERNWDFVDYYNGSIGVIIFLAFVCRRAIYDKLKDRYLTGRVTASTKQETRTSTNTSEQSYSQRVDY